MFFKVIELLGLVILSYFVGSQFIFPALFGRPVLPMIRRERAIKNRLSDLAQKEHELGLEKEASKRESKLTKGNKHG